MADEDAERHALDVCQSMIDISANRLEGLRTQCATSAELTQQEIRTLEGKLIKLFSKQLVTKAKLGDSLPPEIRHLPSLRQWLLVVGLSPESIKAVCEKVISLEALRERSEREIRMLVLDRNACNLSYEERTAREEEVRRLNRALHNLRKYTEALMCGKGVVGEEMALYWDSWDRHQVLKGSSNSSPRPPRTRASRSSVPSEDFLQQSGSGGSSTLTGSGSVSSLPRYTPPNTPPVSKSRSGERVKFPTTPPPRKKHQTGLLPEAYPLTKSKSHESQLANRVDGGDSSGASNEHIPGTGGRLMRRGRLPTEPGPNCSSDLIGQENTSPQLGSPSRAPPSPALPDDPSNKATLQVPKSPRTPTVSRGMGHMIAHRFTKAFKVMTTCDYCDKQMFLGTGLKCKECKYKCHRECESKVPPSCGLPREFLDEFRRQLQPDAVFTSNQSPSSGRPSQSSPSHHPSVLLTSFGWRDRKRSHPQPSVNVQAFPGPDSSSNTSSCNSSTPSSPALVMTAHTPHAASKQQFHFPDENSQPEKGVTLETHPLAPSASTPVSSSSVITNTSVKTTETVESDDLADTSKSNDSERTVSGSDSERTPVRVDSQDSQVSDGEAVERTWPRQNSLSMREWDIPFDELKMGEPIGTGRFGTVYRGNWHGDVAIKVLNTHHLDDEKTLEAFKLEVATFRKTRHENLVLFMGACMKPPRLAIVTSMCKGMTLYTHIHLRKDKFNMNKTTIVAQQISQGMGYLHARGIIHKDLKSKNIFLENGKVVITDFGLFSVTKLCYGNRKGDGLSIPPGWLCYLAPEIVRSLRARQKPDEEELPFTKASDVYAFGTVWYELLCGEWPFKAQPPEAIIWQVGKGMKQSLANLQASRDVKDILMLCWSFRPSDRPDFTLLLKTLEKLPKKRLARSPSHPIHLSRSAESVF
ncbi:kinase suppressor of Ras 2 [Schistocerca cancellata]|uniref:kinase suppressor of Ras 2 n=1 Tax=Schistocerca cancellata TaxID=274614 RepID=UPI002117AABD|nr:kinase suppressor of Ras 2 [Schistocerca cancellata]